MPTAISRPMTAAYRMTSIRPGVNIRTLRPWSEGMLRAVRIDGPQWLSGAGPSPVGQQSFGLRQRGVGEGHDQIGRGEVIVGHRHSDTPNLGDQRSQGR